VPDYNLKTLDYSLEVQDHSSVMIDHSLEIVDFSSAGPDLKIKYKEAHMAHSDWVPTREQDLVDLAERWKARLSDAAKQAAFGWDATERDRKR
jgi:hypothetical protein